MGRVDDIAMGEIETDAPCVQYFRRVRRNTARDAFEFGTGVNHWPVAQCVSQYLASLIGELATDRLRRYDGPDDVVLRQLVADLVGEYVGDSDLDARHISAVNGASEAISLVIAWAGSSGLGATLPLPLYYAFDQSVARHMAAEPIYYSEEHVDHKDTAADRLLVDIVPNGVTGRWQDVPGSAASYGFRFFDHAFALPTFGDQQEFLAMLRSRTMMLEASAIAITPSKDL